MVILIDSREQRPLTFPKELEVRRASLKTGDYTLEGFEDVVCVERKGSVVEFAGNLMNRTDSARFRRELDRMQHFQYKYVILEFQFCDMVRYPWTADIPLPIKKRIARGNKSAYLLKCYIQLLMDYPDIPFIFVGTEAPKFITILFKNLTPSN